MSTSKASCATSAGPEPYLHQLVRLFSYFLCGALFLSFCATLQKLLFSTPLELRGFPIPLVAGGTVGVITGAGLYRYKQLCTGLATAPAKTSHGSMRAILRQVLQFSLFFAGGSLLLSLLTLLQKSLAGYPMQLRMLTIPILFGGFSGVNLGWYVLELSRSKKYRLEDERQYFNLFENANDMIQMVSLQGEILYVNKAWRDALGYQRHELQEINIFQVIHPDTLPDTQQKMSCMLKGEQVPRMEMKYLTSSGETLYVEGSSSISLVEGKPNGFRCILRDISERKRHEEKLTAALQSTRAAHQKLDRILSSVVDGILVIGQNKQIKMINPAAEELLEIPRQQLLGQKLYDALPYLPLGLIEDKSCNDFIIQVPASEKKSQRFLRALISPSTELSVNDQGAILSLRDVTQEKELDRLKNEFISTAAHELRTPLTSIMGFSEFLLTSPPETEAESRKLVNIIHEQAVALSGIIADLLDLSRIESGQSFTLEQSIFSMTELLEQTISQLAPSAGSHLIQLQLAKQNSMLTADRGKIRQLLENIISNAIKYSPEGGTISIKGRECSNCYVLKIEDQGIGMTEEQVERIFEKFYRADYSNTAVAGIGLGMSIVLRIIQAHGGRIRVKSTPGKGTSVTTFLPRAPLIQQ